MTKLLWRPTQQRVTSSNMYFFMESINKKYQKEICTYDGLYQWSVDNISEFWGEVWDFTKILFSKTYDFVLDDIEKMPGARWFFNSRLNFAENLLRYRDDKIALIFKGENRVYKKLTYFQLFDEVAQLAESMKNEGIKIGDRVVGFMPNMPEAIIAMLATVSLGAVWSSCSPDFGIKGVLDRFGQIQPKMLFTTDGYFFKGKKLDSLERVADITKKITSIKKVVVVPYVMAFDFIDNVDNAVFYHDFKSDKTGLEIKFEQLPFEHPIYIMYSSGTTGLPKCMVQSAGGILIHHLKELMLHVDLNRKDVIFYFTTCGWMMWNWLVSSLAVGATLLLYDGNPFYPSNDVLWQMAQDEKMTIFGTSAGYLSALEKFNVEPVKDFDLSLLRTILSTGSPLSEESFEFVYTKIKSDVQLSSIAGGTDLNGCFMLGNPMDPVYSGELQCRGLGMKVYAFDENSIPIYNKKGELVCTAPFPSMPLYFWNDPENKKYHNAYFNVYPNVWCHGDYILINERGSVLMSGRSDATLNPGGVRIGTAEIYRQVEQLKEIEDSIVIGQSWENDVRVILFVKLVKGSALNQVLKEKIRATIRSNASPRHVPSKIIEVLDIPYTINMKKVELAVKKVVHNQEVDNRDVLKNPESLKYYEGLEELLK